MPIAPDNLQPATRVSIYLKDVPPNAELIGPVTLYALLQHEHKITVLNFSVQRNTEYDGSVRSKVGSTQVNNGSKLKSIPIGSFGFVRRPPSIPG